MSSLYVVTESSNHGESLCSEGSVHRSCSQTDLFFSLSWFDVSLQAVDAVGEILLSLSYLPTAERLTVVIAKAKNLVWTNEKTTAGVKLS